jgi:hypothetical protein
MTKVRRFTGYLLAETSNRICGPTPPAARTRKVDGALKRPKGKFRIQTVANTPRRFAVLAAWLATDQAQVGGRALIEVRNGRAVRIELLARMQVFVQ